MKKKLLIIATLIIAMLFSLIAVSCLTEEPTKNNFEATNYVIVDNFTTVRNAFDCEVLVPVDNYLNAKIKMTAIEILHDESERTKFIHDINNRRKLGYVYAVDWTHSFTEYDISVEILKNKNFKSIPIEIDEIIIHGYSGIQSKDKGLIILNDIDNHMNYLIKLRMKINDARIDIDKTIREYIDGMCLRNGNGFKTV